ncbi:MAG TPA: hypothetical protein P5567_09405 [Kiritimatiellia bacterium]|nr:hypothetical protein [Kiritimatiellia bacterium]HRZ12656.1 hypothetical protein [Kiritimatiellia bacterium]HSA19576.1 hypothetical protein [Kiritimatiellia bacterium]
MTLRPWLNFAASALAQLLVALLFSRLHLIPLHLDFNPGIVLTPLAGILFGAAGVWSALAASLGADWLLGTLGAVSLFQAAGMTAFAWTAWRLWDAAPEPEASWGRAVFFVTVCVPGALASAAWRALGSELLGLYPYAYIVGVAAVHHMVFCILLGPPLLMAALRFEEPRPAPTSLRRAAAIAGGAVAAALLGVGISRSVYGIGPFEPFVLGLRAGRWVPAAVIPLLLFQLAALAGARGPLWRGRRGA